MILTIMLQMVNDLNIQQKKVRKTREKGIRNLEIKIIKTEQPAVPSFNVEITIPLKYLRNFWRFFDLSLIKCEIQLDLS